ncbi:MAG: right-handed parallel beta-helix repeat-containing protein [Pirellulaceae bacterium]
MAVVIHEYILILSLLLAVGGLLVYFIRSIAFPKVQWLAKQYREAYKRFLCPVCAYPIRTGPRRFLFWTRRTRNRTMITKTQTLMQAACWLASLHAGAAEIYVSPSGQDSNPGTRAQPYATLQVAVDKLQAGDTLLVRGGTYRETVTFPRSDEPDKPITVRPYQDERVVISGCDAVSGWTLHDAQKGIWKAPMPWTLGLGRNQAFADGKVLIEARYPNKPAPGLEMYVADLSPLWPTFGEFSIPKETIQDRPGRIVSALLDGQPDDYWKGAIYYGVHYEGWAAQTGVVESSKSGEINLTDRTRTWWFGSAYGAGYAHEEGRGMLVGHMNALDQPGEWQWQDNTLYLIPLDGKQPTSIEAKRRQLAFDLSGQAHINIHGLTVVAASARLEDSANCTFAGCDFSYISHYTRHYSIGQIEDGRDTIKSGETGIFVGGHDNSFLNCSVRISAGAGFHLRGYHHTIHNCLIDEISYTAHYLNAITDAVSDFPDYEDFLVGGHVITYNTMRNAGRHFFNFYGNGPSLASRTRSGMDYMATLFAHNHLYNGLPAT